MFIDRVVVNVKAGDGGSGIISFRREKFVPMGGPDGGEGGRGGDVIIVGDSNLATLLDYTYRDSWTAPAGDHGSGSNKSGKSGSDVLMPVPIGTVVRDLETSELLGEILEDGDRIVVDLLKVPKLSRDPRIRKALSVISPVLGIRAIETDRDHLYVKLRATPAGLPEAIGKLKSGVAPTRGAAGE